MVSDRRTDGRRVSRRRSQRPWAIVEDHPNGHVGVATPWPVFTPLMNNPYPNILLGGLYVWLGWFLLTKLGAPWGWVLLGLFGIGGLWLVALFVRKIPSWHRGRRLARAYIAEHGGRMPPERRWYT